MFTKCIGTGSLNVFTMFTISSLDQTTMDGCFRI